MAVWQIEWGEIMENIRVCPACSVLKALGPPTMEVHTCSKMSCSHTSLVPEYGSGLVYGDQPESTSREVEKHSGLALHKSWWSWGYWVW